jgi:UDP-glucose 4-epimerase
MSLVLVTGGAGFIGANLVRALLAAGFAVRTLDDLSTGRAAHLDDLRGSIERHRGSVTDVSAVTRAVDGTHAVVHLAARSGVPPSIQDPRADFKVNVEGTFNVFDAARRGGARRVVFASSGAVLAGAAPPLHEALSPQPLSPYGASKLYGEGLVKAFEGSYGMVGVSLRFANVYGPYCFQKESVVARLAKRALAGQSMPVNGTGAQTRDFIYVGDIVRAIILSLGVFRGGVYHLGTGCETTVLELARLIRDVAGRPVVIEHSPARRGDPARNYPDVSLAREQLGWRPEVDLSAGLTSTCAWLSEEQAKVVPRNRAD